MEERRIDPLQIIGFFLLFLVLIWMMYNQSEMMEQNAQMENNPTNVQSQVDDIPLPNVPVVNNAPVVMDTIPELVTTLQNELLRLAITSKGGFIQEDDSTSIDSNWVVGMRIMLKKCCRYEIQDTSLSLSSSSPIADKACTLSPSY